MVFDADLIMLFIKQHTNRRPKMGIRDIYKLFYQGILGPEHIISSSDYFIQRLEAEWEGLETTESDPLWEPVRPDEKLLRINLRPYKNAAGSLELLADACLNTARQHWGTKGDLAAVWEHFTKACKEGFWTGADLEEFTAFTSFIKKNDYPAVHHSEMYRLAYKPAYRLIADIFLLQWIGDG
jgi:hypothetical protein